LTSIVKRWTARVALTGAIIPYPLVLIDPLIAILTAVEIA
jgi:hypothetical protein